jgi:hypothetical protein
MPYSRRIPFVSNALTYAQQVLADTPVGYWKMDEASGNAADSSGNAMTLTAQGTPTYRDTGPGTGNFGITLVSASTQYFFRADDNLFDLGDILTLEVWYKRSAVQGTTQTFICKGGNTYHFGIDTANKPFFNKTDAAGILNATTLAITDTTTWHHVVYTKNGATSKMYVDGADTTGVVTNATLADNTNDLAVGAKNGGVTLDGTLSHVAMYATALSAARVSAHYTAMV